MNHIKKLNITALVLLPAFAVYCGETEEYRRKVSGSIEKLAQYFPKLHIFLTDETAQAIRPSCAEWVQPVPDEDMMFIRNNCTGMGFLPPYAVKDADLHNRLRGRFPIPRGLTPKARLSVAVKRNNAAIRELKQAYKAFIIFRTAAVAGVPDTAFSFKIAGDLRNLELCQAGVLLSTKDVLGEEVTL